VPDAVLLKPGYLTHAERALMRRHPAIGHAMITHIPFLARASEVVLHHHEAYDGSGYPAGLKGRAIPLGARIFAVADTFDSMTTDRPYRKALPWDVALAEITRCRGTQFDPAVVDALLAVPEHELRALAVGVNPAAVSGVDGRVGTERNGQRPLTEPVLRPASVDTLAPVLATVGAA
jgi:HD-GYP domain-containing protein (c-di-GMP phosphodiesterase class II)